MREVPRSTIERCAHILGSASAAHLALAEADARHAKGENIAFFMSGSMILVGPPFALADTPRADDTNALPDGKED
jgi:hypothetical protein